MEAPPQFSGAPKKSKTGLIIGVIALVIVLCCCGGGGALFYFGRGVFGKALGLVECSTAMAQQRGGLVAYANAHNGKLPRAASWQDDVRPYVTKNPDMENQKMISIPGPEAAYCDKGGATSITYNAAIAGKTLADIKDPYETTALYETPGLGRNKAAPYKEQPFEASPVMMKGQRRGWIVQPLKGQASYKDQYGSQHPANGIGVRGRVGTGGDDFPTGVDVVPSKGKAPAKGTAAGD